MALFGKPKYTIVRLKKKEIPDGLWTKCAECSETLYNKTLEENFRVCPKCNYHFGLTAYERIDLLLDKDTFVEFDKDMVSADPLDFKGPKTYKDKLKQDQEVTGLKDAVISGEGKINSRGAAVAVTDSRFIMGSMGSVVGEKITRAIEYATKNKLPMIIVSGSGGGARMYEGLYSLMQMAKTCAALSYHHKASLPYISVLTNPTMAGIMASFAGVGDIIMAEPNALIGFTGPRVIEQTIRQKLPLGFQRSEFLLDHGLIDMIVHRKNMKGTLSQLLDYFA
ncbi:MAG: acetyl-CoA carboxylase, carboxyltransferase subunit beta [Candidatus Omnitrophica bacterium]|nr:acetyl-CoA carboxylase, carboxyltransferase subunit beta [Candidatus Omnitrophota bacterium]MBU4303424.1 acetyl-CoA carboxylase, carboxyltransferase subunit beta [Candidatus Omnitrophota bacterium]MBU4418677.1 acetyl-CoA carboxylase, carboxyltransferase subunit beta [Candidatus Omnitrophota bacterium]MBU4467132.1 acetyl-CoA carboxylase, carboxyltransferase subunit beta [Candidatus Omnitrophota bacterium]MCG2708097.1 acetyl-CoA carboxylase, carboxyltransferase subunit beta [Candidatus Omnitro